MSDKLPPGWAQATMSDVAEVHLGRQRSPQHHSGDQMRPYLRSANVTWSGIDLGDVKEMNFDDADFERYRLRNGDLLLNEASGSPNEVGKPAVWRGEIDDCCFQNTLLRLQPRELDRRYVYWYCYLSARMGHFGDAGRGVNIRHLGKQGLARFPIPIAPVAEQERIVAAIEEHFSRLDAADRALADVKRRIEFLHRSASLQLIDQSSWPSTTLGDVAEVFVGSTPSRAKPDLWAGPIPWVSSGEIQFGRIRDTREHIAAEAVSTKRVHPPGTVLLGMIGEGKTRCQAAVLEIPAAHSQNSAAIRVQRSRMSPDWLFHVLRAQYESNRRIGSGNNQPALNKSRVCQLEIPLPPLEEQNRLVGQLDATRMTLDQIVGTVALAQRRCSALRRIVLADAFAGRLVPQDPDDEPASVLLERIAASRLAKPAHRRRTA